MSAIKNVQDLIGNLKIKTMTQFVLIVQKDVKNVQICLLANLVKLVIIKKELCVILVINHVVCVLVQKKINVRNVMISIS